MQAWDLTYDWEAPRCFGRRGWDPDAQVTLRAHICGPDAARARVLVAQWFGRLRPLDDAPAGLGAVTGGVWMTCRDAEAGGLIVDIHSAGEDGVESVHGASHELADTLAGLDVLARYEQQPLQW